MAGSTKTFLLTLALATATRQCSCFVLSPSAARLGQGAAAYPATSQTAGSLRFPADRTRLRKVSEAGGMVEMSTPGGKPETPPPWGPPPPWREEKKGPLGRLLAWRPKKVSSDQLAAMGVATLLAYGAVSNVNMAACVILSWVTYGKTTGPPQQRPDACWCAFRYILAP